MYRKQIKH